MRYPAEESSTLEFKKEVPHNDHVIRTIVGFCNQKAGELIIGVDNRGIIHGIPEEKITAILEHLDKLIYASTTPTIIPRIYYQRIGDKLLLIIKISEGMSKPYYITKEGIEKGTYIRLGRTTMQAKPETIEELKWQTRPRTLSYDSMPVYHAKLDDLDTEKFREFLSLRRFAPKEIITIDKLLRSYNLIVDEHGYQYPTVAGILLFGKDPQRFFPEAYIISTEFKGIAGREALSTINCVGTLFDQYYKAYSFVTERLSHSFTIKGRRRKEMLEVPEVALRETIVNAIIHRNYHINAPTKIALYDNRIEVFSPGDFPGQLPQENLRSGISYIRNYAITKVFHEIGYSEKLGSGLNALFESYEERGLEEPHIIEGANYVKYILPRPSTKVRATEATLDDESRRILKLLKTTTDVRMSDIIEQLQIQRSTAGRRIAQLVKEGLIQKIGKGKGTRYRLK